ncbi:MAG: hypothetical protein IIT65_11085, partial [Lachnospiraceae bacterium]|nr:hypothetical protein [Lachnospiraceae bacterium]
IYPIPKGKSHYTWSILKGKSIASVDKKGVLTISTKAKPGDTFRVKTSAVVENINIKIKPSIVDYIVK